MSNTNQPIVNSELSNHLNASLNQQLPQFDLNEIYSTMINNELLNFDTNVHFNESFVWALIDEQLQTDDAIDDIPSNKQCVNADQDINLDFTPDEMTELLNDTNVCLSQPTIKQLSLAQFDSIFSEELSAQQQLINAQLQTNDHIDDIPSNQLCAYAEFTTEMAEQISLTQFNSIFSEELTTQQQQLINAEAITNSQFNSFFAEELQAELLG